MSPKGILNDHGIDRFEDKRAEKVNRSAPTSPFLKKFYKGYKSYEIWSIREILSRLSVGKAIAEDHLQKHELFVTVPPNIYPLVRILLVEVLEIELDVWDWLLDVVFVVGFVQEGADWDVEQDEQD